MAILNANQKKLVEYLTLKRGGQFYIPWDQRPYEWNKSHIERLFDDIISVYNKQKQQHVLNFFTIFKEEDSDRQEIFDGQQRTVSLLIIISILVKVLDKIDEETAKQIKNDYFSEVDWRKKDPVYKLNFDDENAQKFYVDHIIGDEPIPADLGLTDYTKSLKSNFIAMKTKINKFLKSEIEKRITEENISNIEKLETAKEQREAKKKLVDGIQKTIVTEIITTLENDVSLILLQTSDKQIALQMFESLNNTGKNVAKFYVLKNDLSQILGADEIADEWEEIEANSNNLNKIDLLVNFASLFNGYTSKDAAHSKLVACGKLEKDIDCGKETLSQLKQASLQFLYLREPYHYLSNIKNETDCKERKNIKEITSTLEALKLFKATSFYPIFIAMQICEYETSEVLSTLKTLLQLQIRNVFICNDDNSRKSFSKGYPNLSRDIMNNNKNGNKLSLEEIKERIKESKLSDEKVKEIFKTKIFNPDSERDGTKYILRRIYNSDSNQEVEISENNKTIHLEHILPQNPDPTSQWLVSFGENIEVYKYRFGNLTLIKDEINTSIQNKDFTFKKEGYNGSFIYQNRNLKHYTDWGKTEIDQRTASLAESFLKIW